MNLHVSNNPSSADPVHRIADQAETLPAPTRAGRAKLPQKNWRALQQVCECTKPATVYRSTSKLCADCARLGAEETPRRCGVPDREPPHVGWLDVRKACNDWLLANGLSIDPQPSIYRK